MAGIGVLTDVDPARGLSRTHIREDTLVELRERARGLRRWQRTPLRLGTSLGSRPLSTSGSLLLLSRGLCLYSQAISQG